MSADELAATQAAAPTSASQNHLAYALAALPDPDGKRAVWDELSGTGELSNFGDGRWRRASGSRPGRPASAVRRPVRHGPAGHLGAAHPRAGRGADPVLFPATIVEASVLERTEALVGDDAVPGQRRLVLESRDALARALRNRSLA